MIHLGRTIGGSKCAHGPAVRGSVTGTGRGARPLTAGSTGHVSPPTGTMVGISRIPAATLELQPPAALPTVFDEPDDALLAPLGADAVTRVKPNRGGTSLSLRLDFANGSRAAFKPQQIHLQSEPRREIAAYRIDRLLGIGHVAPAKPAKFTVTELVAAADPQLRTVTTERILGETRKKDGEVRGFIAWWIPEIRDARVVQHLGRAKARPRRLRVEDLRRRHRPLRHDLLLREVRRAVRIDPRLLAHPEHRLQAVGAEAGVGTDRPVVVHGDVPADVRDAAIQRPVRRPGVGEPVDAMGAIAERLVLRAAETAERDASLDRERLAAGSAQQR